MRSRLAYTMQREFSFKMLWNIGLVKKFFYDLRTHTINVINRLKVKVVETMQSIVN